MLEDGRPVGPSTAVLELRTCGLLRFIQEQACHEALSCDQACHHAINRAWGKLGLVLHRSTRIGFCLSITVHRRLQIWAGKTTDPHLSESRSRLSYLIEHD